MATMKQIQAVRNIAANGGNLGKAMIEAGYKESVARNPSNLTKSKSWPILLEKHLPDKHLGKKHRTFLDADRIIRTYKKGDLVSETTETDPSAVKALDMAYKLKGRYSSDDVGSKTLIINISGESASRYGVSPTIHDGK